MLLTLLALAACQPDPKSADADGDGLVGTDDCDDGDATIGAPARAVYTDGDLDGYGDDATLHTACALEPGVVEIGGDCVDTDSFIHPAVAEICDGVDQDCDGTPDDGVTTDFYADVDGDTFGDASTRAAACEVPAGAVTNGEDCDDAAATTHPGADELCDGADQDCDGEVDEEPVDAFTWYADADRDGYGDPAAAVVACAPPGGVAGDGTDCDDTRSDIHRDAEEVCDNDTDENCDGAAPACGFGGTYALASDDYTITGGATLLRLGSAVVNLGDVDADGLDDLAVSGGHGEGFAATAWIVRAADLRDDTIDAVAAAEWVTIEGCRVMAGVGDVTGDAMPDLLVGSYGVGQAWIVSGDSTGYNYLEDAPTRIEATEERLGYAVTTAGDLDGDGNRDFLVGAPSAGSDGEGAVYLFRGPVPSGTLDPGDADSALTGSLPEGYVGYAAAGGHDLDGDGLDDPVAATWVGGGDLTGRVFVVYDPALGQTSLAAADVELTGTNPDDYHAWYVASIGDTDGDGYGELAIAAHAEGAEAGAVYVVAGPPASGVTSAVAAVKFSGNVDARLGEGLTDLGDIDGDGLADLGLGSPDDASSIGAAFVVHGPLGTGTIAVSGADAVFQGLAPRSQAGFALASADVSGDGWSDLLVTAPLYAEGLWVEGALHVVLAE